MDIGTMKDYLEDVIQDRDLVRAELAETIKQFRAMKDDRDRWKSIAEKVNSEESI